MSRVPVGKVGAGDGLEQRYVNVFIMGLESGGRDTGLAKDEEYNNEGHFVMVAGLCFWFEKMFLSLMEDSGARQLGQDA